MPDFEIKNLNIPTYYNVNKNDNLQADGLVITAKNNKHQNIIDAQDLSRGVILQTAIGYQHSESKDYPVLSKRRGVKPADFGLTVTDLIFLLKKLDQIALKQSSDGMVAAKASVDRKAEAIKQEGILNCASQVTGTAVQLGVTLFGSYKSRKSLAKQNSIEKNSQNQKNKSLAELDNKLVDNKNKLSNDFDKQSVRYANKGAEVNNSTKSQINKLKNEISNLEDEHHTLLKANKNISSNESDYVQSKINYKKSELARLEGELSANTAMQRESLNTLSADKDKELAKLQSGYDRDKFKIENEPEPLNDTKAYQKAGDKIERYRSYGHLSHAIGSIFSSSIAVAAYTEKAKQANAELESSVDHKTTDNNRDRSNSYKSSASELINSINNILEKHASTIGDIARKC